MKTVTTVSGEITAFLSLIFVLLISFILALTESASIQTTKNQKRLDVDRAIFSVFGEYQKELLENYEVFGLDVSYQSGTYEESKLLDRLAYYGSEGIEQEITDIQLLTDNDGQAFREQVLAFMEEKDGIAVMQELTGLAEKWEETEIKGKEVSGQLEDGLRQCEGALETEASGLLQARADGVLSLVLPKSFTLSGKSIMREQQVSQRSLRTGRGTFPARKGTGGIEGKLLFEQYVEDCFGSAVDTKGKNRSLEYELEYLLCGEASDVENLKAVVNRLLLVRFATNYQYLSTSVARQEEVAVLAATLSAVVLQPELFEGIKSLLLVLWAFGESVVDIRSLLAGNRVAMIKGDENWQLQLSSLFKLGTAEDIQDGQDDEGGLKYTQYLEILLFLEKESELNMRTLDRIEENLIQEAGVSKFWADACVTKVKVKNKAEIWNGKNYEFPVSFGYL